MCDNNEKKYDSHKFALIFNEFINDPAQMICNVWMLLVGGITYVGKVVEGGIAKVEELFQEEHLDKSCVRGTWYFGKHKSCIAAFDLN